MNFIVVLLAANVLAQAPEKMSYQAVIRNSSNALVTNTQIGMQISIRQGTPTGAVLYTETQTPTTNANGLVSIEIGGQNGFDIVNWANGPVFMEIQTAVVPPLTTYTITTTTQLISVPYALHAKTASFLLGGVDETDPIFTGWDKSTDISITKSQISDLGSIIETEADPVFAVSAASGIAGTNITNWNTAFSWGNHATAGYVTNFSETDPFWSASPSHGITNTNLSNWNTAFGWGNHATAGYLTNYSETDPTVPAYVKSITSTNITNWNLAHTHSATTTGTVHGSTTVGANLLRLTNPSAIMFLRINADNSVSALTAADFRTAIGVGTGSGSVTSVAAGNGLNFTTITNSGSVTLGTPSSITNATTNSVTATSHTHAITSVLPSSTSAGIMAASGSKVSGGFYGGTTAPSNTTRLNYDGYLFATQLYDGANRVYSAGNTNIGTLATNYAAGNHTHSGMGTVTSIATGNGITGGTITATGTLGLTGQALALHNLNSNGIIARTGSGTVAARTIAASGNGVSVSNGDGVSGNPTVSLSIGTGATQVAAGNHTHDGSETKVTAGTNVTVTGSGTTGSPYVINSSQAPGTAAGQMQYWNGTSWITVATGTEGQVLKFVSGVPTWKSEVGDNFVINFATGKIWMDRNLGATQVATSSTDANSYGDLYQWGRGTDGHQIRTSGTTAILSTTNTPGHGNFILNGNSPYDWRSPQNNNLWQGIIGTNNPCPSGYRLPTEAEWNAERLSWGSNNSDGAFGSPLKLPMAGHRNNSDGSLFYVGSSGYYSSSTVDGISSKLLGYSSVNANILIGSRALGFSVRCIKD